MPARATLGAEEAAEGDEPPGEVRLLTPARAPGRVARGRLNVARWLPRSAVNGPGERFVLWLQGCPLRCPGCWNPDTWSFEPRTSMDVGEVLALVRREPGIEGLTLTGGEPFAQAAAVLPLVEAVKRDGLSVMIFTGYELEELRDPAARAVLDLADVAVTGRYVEAERCLDLPWRGSRNQRVRFLSGRYGPRDLGRGGQVEIHVGANGAVAVTGFPEPELLGDRLLAPLPGAPPAAQG